MSEEILDTAQALDGSLEETQDTLDTDVENEGEGEGIEEQEGTDTSDEQLYAGKYKSVDELEKAYNNMVKQGTKLAQQLSEMRKGQQQQQPLPIPQGTLATQPNPFLQQMAPFIAPLAQQVKALQEQQQQMAMQTEVSRLRSTYNDFDEVATILPKLFETTPALFNLPNPVETAYLIAKSQYAQEQVKTVYDEATRQAYSSKESKKKAMTESQQSKQQSSKTPEEEIIDDIFNASNQGGSIF